MNMLVGYTGFVGSNIYSRGNMDKVYNSSNIEEAYGLQPDLLIYAGLRAEKYLANKSPDKDMGLILQAEENIARIEPKKLVLISTVDVLKNPIDVDERGDIDCNGLQPYGLNRYNLECWVRDRYPNALIIRLPGLFGENIKKNFIYDAINKIPFMLKTDRFTELMGKAPELGNYYSLCENGFYKCNALNDNERKYLRKIFIDIGFTALNFTDSRSVFQFYPLERLWDDIQIALDNDIKLWHPATAPVSAGELYAFLNGTQFVNELDGVPVYYNYRTVYDTLFGGVNGYICDKEKIMCMIKEFVERKTTNEK